MGTTRTCCSVLLAILLPPIGVFLQFGCGLELCINILLTCLGYVPGIIHALCIIGFASDVDRDKGLPVANPAVPTAQPVAAPHHQGYTPPPYPAGAQPVAIGQPVAPPPHQQGGAYPSVPPAGYPPKV